MGETLHKADTADVVEDTSIDDAIEVIARVAHEANRAYCRGIGDDSQPSWDDAPDWQKESARNGVWVHIKTPDMTPEASHESWLKYKLADGWTWGPEKNPELKQHPCCVPYSELPDAQRFKDVLFAAVCDALGPLMIATT